ncbi:hypothetical protein MHK_006066, partial [Candidatus Magnetomorum sp. HK-1]
IYINNPLQLIFGVKGIDPQNNITFDIQYVHNNKSFSIKENLPYTTKNGYRWIPQIPGENIYVQVQAKDDKGNVSEWEKSNTFNIIDYIKKKTEIPSKTYLSSLGKSTNLSSVIISWKKLIYTNNEHNVDKYEIEYADNKNFTGSKSITEVKIPTGNLYEYFDHEIKNLEDNKTYY